MANEVLELEHAMFSPYFEGESRIGQGRFGVRLMNATRSIYASDTTYFI